MALAAVLAAIVYFVRRPAAITVAAALTALCLVYVKLSAWPLLDRLVTARPLWHEVQPQASSTCIETLPRALRYGLNYYSRESVPDCRDVDRPIRLNRDASSALLPSEPVPAPPPR